MASIPTKKEKHRSHKRKKTERTETLTLDGLKTLGHQLLSSRAHVNNLPVLLSFISPSASLDFALESLISIQSFFTPIVPEIPSSSVKSGNGEKDPEAVYRAWLRNMFDEFINSLIVVAVSPQSAEALQDIAMETIMDFVKTGKNGKFQTAIYHRFLHGIVHATSSVDSLLDSLASKYFNYIDVCFFTYTSMGKIAKTCDSSKTTETKNSSMRDQLQPSNSSKTEDSIRIIYNILSHIPPLESADKERSHEMWSKSGLSMDQISRRLKLKFTKAWISFLKSPLPLDVYKEVLIALHKKVIPHMANPAILCDFLTRSYDIGGVISVMALNGLFILMTQYGLEYPKFYEKLYALLTPAVFMAKHRAAFFQLLDTCLKSSYLPAYLAAAFAKKLSRLALSVPPSGALVIIAVIYNLLRRHPSINFLVHQEVDNKIIDDSLEENVHSKDEKESNDDSGLHIKKHGFDPFDDEESNPANSGAMRSSLWEMDTLRSHYCPAVSRFVASMENDLTNRAKTSEVEVADFSSGSYATIFGDEIRRRIKQVPLAFYKVAPTCLFWESDFAGWTFGGIKNDGETIVQESGATNNIENGDHGPVKRQCIERL